ncbi:MAG: hypothetical protein DDT39_00032 [Firmicutes bacterium]|nr:hypothetical protein [candidate division NPL-UPA2 bacterium]
MTPNEYQTRAAKFAVYPLDRRIEYVALGLASEAGEIAGKIKKKIRDGANWSEEQHDAHRCAVIAELGDVLWYAAEVARQFNSTLEDVMQHNLDKLESRQQRGVLTGNGDTR